MAGINFARIEAKWQKRWEDKKAFEVKENSKKKKFYVLEMFPYPSGSGLHMGHALNYTIGDIFARFKRMKGFNVLYPMGYDALGLPAENAAIKDKTHPEDYTKASMRNFMKQQKMLGLSYDWSRLINTSSTDYYKWDQWIFLKMFEKGLAYQKEASVNWCPSCKTVLANEQAQTGNCDRCGTKVEIKTLKQWFLKITNYADELLDKLDDLDWPARTKAMQKNWIGKSYGTEIDFDVEGLGNFPIFTTRPDTIFGVTFMVISSQHPKLFDLVTKEQKKEVEKFLKKLKGVSEKQLEELDKQGVFTGSYAINPVTKEKIPIYAGNFVVADYGSGMVMAVPAHDQRDFLFAKKYEIPIKVVIDPVGLEIEYENISKVVIVHGANDSEESAFEGGRENTRHWFPWLKKKLEEQNILVSGELYPKDWNPDYKEWKKIFEKNNIDENTILVGHSLGCGFISRWLSENKKKVKKVILVAPYILDDKELPGLKEMVNFNLIDISKYCNNLQIFYSDNDYNFILKSVDYLKKKTNGTFKEFYGTGHFCKSDGFTKFPELLNEIISYKMPSAYTSSGNLINSGKFNGLDNEKAKEEITKYLIKKKLGRKKIQFKLRDWLISRQRYWGTPIPIAHCEKCGAVPVAEKDLPVKLPKEVKFGKGNPLTTNEKWIKTKCPKCKGNARRETDTMDTFVNSSWYFLRYCDPKNNKKIFDKKKVDYWMPIDQYIGGAEHACMHLIYFRFYTKFLRDIGLLNFDEPAKKLFHQGMLHGEDGEKMSKSRGNVVLPEVVSKQYGIDTARMFLVSVASPENDIDWSEKGIEGSSKFVNKLFEYFDNVKISKKSEPKIESKLNKIIKEVTNQIENFKYNLAVIKIRELFNFLPEECSKDVLEKSLKLLSAFCPHIAEELWSKLDNKNFISLSSWPVVDEKKIDDKFEKEDEAVEKLVGDIVNISKIVENKKEKKNKVYVYVMPNELEFYSAGEISKRVGKDVQIFAVNDKNKYDPNNISKKSKPGKPGIYFE